MRWNRANGTPMLALRTGAANDRWAAAWGTRRAYTRAQTAARRQQHRQQRRLAATALPSTPTLVVLPPIPTLTPPPTPLPRRATAIPALPPERTRSPHPWSFRARLNARSLPDPSARK